MENSRISLSEFIAIKGELRKKRNLPGELNVTVGESPDRGYVVLIEGDRVGNIMITGETIIRINDDE